MKNHSAGSFANAHFTRFHQLVVTLCAVAVATLLPHQSPAQQITYNDFNGPATAPAGQTSTACLSNSVPSGVLFCFNGAAGSAGVSFVQDSYPPSIDPNASSDGDTGSTNYALQLTESAMSQDSSVWYSIPQDVVDGFTVWYAVKLNYQYAPPNYFTGDGMAFVIQNAAGGATDTITNSSETGSGLTALGGGGGALGYGGIDNSVALEMDTFLDAPYDPNDGVTFFPDDQFDDNHLALQSCGPGNPNSPSHLTSPNCLITLSNGPSTLVSNPNTSAAPPATAIPVILADANPHQVVMVYNGPEDAPANNLTVYLDPALNPGTHTPVTGSVPLFSGSFDITKYINLNNGTAYIGFTAANGGDFEQHEVMGFSFTPHGFNNVNVCPSGQTSPAPCSYTLPVTFNIAAGTTIGSVQVVTQGAAGYDFQDAVSGDTCVGTFSSAASCTVNVTFAPLAPGLRLGAVNLVNGSTVVATQLISGVGQGPQATFSPLTTFVQNSGGNSLNAPMGVAVDVANNVFIADTGNQRVLKVTGNTSQIVATQLSRPQGVAVDGAGNLYVADSALGGNGEVLELAPGCTNSSCWSVLYSAQGPHAGPFAVAVDGSDNVFIADNPNGVFEIPANGSGQTLLYNPTNSQPTGVAVDATGDLFISDSGLHQVVEFPAGCGSSCQKTIGLGWANPASVAVDAAGDVIVADTGVDEVIEVPVGCTIQACQVIMAFPAFPSLADRFQPFDAVPDSQGDIHIADVANNRIDVILPELQAFNFAESSVGNESGDVARTVLFQNIGNQTLTATGQGLVLTDPNFSQAFGTGDPGTPADCTASFSLSPGAACNLSATFTPLITGTATGYAEFYDNNLNNLASIQAFPFTGTGVSNGIEYSLSVANGGPGSGTVTDNLTAINCILSGGSTSGSCSGSYESGVPVTLTATPSGSASFLGWGGACASSGTSSTCTVSMTGAMNVTAQFGQPSLGNINVCTLGGVGQPPCSSSQQVTFTATATVANAEIQVVTQGTGGLDFTLGSTTCGGNISAGTSCTITVNFAPKAPGLRIGAVEISGFANSVNGLVASIPVSGIGQAPEIAYTPASPAAVILGGGYSLSQPVAVDAASNIYFAATGQAYEKTSFGVQTLPSAGQFYGARSIAVDGAGDVFVADNDHGQVFELPANGGAQTTVYPPLDTNGVPSGVAVDGKGDLFVADSYQNEVVEISADGGSNTVLYGPISSGASVNSVAVDAAGDVFVALTFPGSVIEIPAGCTSNSCQIPVGTGWNDPAALALDAAGNLYVADPELASGNGEIVQVTPRCSSAACQYVLANGNTISGGVNAFSLALDGQGNVYYVNVGSNEHGAGSGIAQLVEIAQSQVPSLNFGATTAAGTSSSPLPVTLQNIGNQPLSVGVFSVGSPFAQIFNGNDNPADCTNSGNFSLSPAQSCTASITFNPPAGQFYSADVEFTDDSLNTDFAPFQQIALGGTGTGGVVNFSLSVSTAGAGSGSIGGTNCTTGNYSTGTTVICTENPGGGSQFTGWSGGTCSGTGSCSFTLTANSTVVANFSLTLSYALNVTEIGTGTGTGTGTVTSSDTSITCTSGSSNGCSASYPSTTSVMLRAAATGTSTFLGWGGACASAGTNPQCMVTMNTAENVTASFSQQSFGSVSVCAGGIPSAQCIAKVLAVTFSLSTDTTIGSVQVVTQGATGLDFSLSVGSGCSGFIAAGNSCTVNVNFAPLAPGLRMGAVELLDNNGNLLASAPVYGIGQAAEAAFSPAPQTTVPGTALNQPYGLAVDAAGDTFIGEPGVNLVLKVAPGGAQSTVGTFTGHPYGLAVDGAGDVFIAELNSNRVDEVTPSGVQTVVPATGLTQPIAVAVDGAGDLFISDRNNSRVVELPAGCTTGSCQITLPTVGLGQPYGLALDAAGDVFIADFNNNQVIKVTPGGVQTTVPTTGLHNPYGVAVDTAGDVYIVSFTDGRVIEVTPSGVQTTVAASGLSGPSGLALDGAGDLFISDYNNNRVVELERPQTTSLGFALTNQGSTSTDSPQFVSLQNVGNQSLTGGVTPTSTTNFLENVGSTCGSAFSLVPGAVCSESFGFAPQTTGYLTDAAFFSDNTLNLVSSVVAQAVNLSGVGDLPGQSGGVIVPNVVGMTQTAATSALTGAGLALGSVSSEYSSGEPAGSVIGENPAAGTQVTAGSAVKVLLSIGEAPPPSPNPLTFENNYFVTGDYATGGVSFNGVAAQNGLVSGNINISAGNSNGVPTGADIIDAFLYWTTLENTANASGGSGTFLGYSITGQQIGSDLPNYTDGALTGTLRAYRADVNTYLPNGANGVRLGSGSFNVALPEGSNALPLTEGASLVVIYRALVPPNSANPPSLPLKSVVIYDGLTVPSASGSQNIQGFYDAAGPSVTTTTLSTAPGNLTISNSSVVLTAGASQYAVPLSAGAASFAVILSTPVANTDNDGILDAWKAGPASTSDFFHGQPGYYDVKTQSWVPLPGAKHGQQDLFVQFDWMCGAVDSNGNCTGEDLYPSPDSDGNDPLAIVQQSFLNIGIHLHLEVGNAVPETTCNDATSPQPCQFPGQPGVIGWKNSLEFSKIWPRNFTTCAAGGDCTARFPFGQKDSYHYVLFGHSLAIPAWNSRYASLVSITVAGPVTTIVTTDRGSGINACPNRITISGVLGNPGLNGVYTTTGCADTKTMTIATPTGVPNWSYPNSTLPEPVIGITSGKVTSISGYSDLGGADSAVTLALWETAPNQDMSKRANVIAGTLFHEIGHTLGLTHGGLYYQTPGSYVPTFDVNCKPNYQSSMNYLFQLDGVGPNGAVAYSNQTLETLNDTTGLTGLTQLTDINDAAPTFSTSAWYSPTAPSTTASAATLHCDGTPLNGDTGYRIDGSIAPITPAWTNNQNIAFDGVTYSQLLGYNDVSNIDLRQVGATGGEFASLAGILSFGNSATPLTVPAGGNVSLGSGGTVALGSGGNVTLGSGGNVTLGSGGTITPGSNGTVTLNNGGTATLSTGGTISVGASGGTVTLGSGGVIALGSGATIGYGNSGGNVTLGSGGNVTLGSGGTIALGSGISVTIPSSGGAYAIDSSGGTITLGSGGTVALGSGGNVTLGSGGTIALGSGGNVTLGSGGNVTLGSGGTIALGSGGTVALGSGGNVTLGSGGTVALGSGGNVTLGSGGNVTLGSGGLVTLGSGGDVSVGAGGNVTLGSGGTVTLGSGGNVTLGSGGNVTLGSGGTIALGSGGTIALGSGGVVALGSGGLVTLGSGGTITSSNGIAVIGAGGSYTLPAGGGTIALGSGGNITLGSGGNVTLGSGGNVTLGSGGTITMGSGGTVTLGSGGNVTLGSGGVVALGSGGNVTLGSGGTIALGSGGNVTLGSGGVTSTEMDYDTANSIVRPPPLASETSTPIGVRVNWIPPAFGVVNTYTVLRSSNGEPPIVVGSVSGVNGFAPSTAFTDSNPDTTSQTVTYTITTTLVPDTGTSTQRSSLPSPPAVITNDQTIVLGTVPNPVALPGPLTVTATAESNSMPNGLQVSFSAMGNCSIGSQTITNGVSSASVTLASTGSCTVTASQPGTNLSQSGILSYYNAATPLSATFTIQAQGSNLQSQTINFPILPNIQYGSTFLLSATSSSGETVTFVASGPCGINGATTGVGVCMITASAPGDNTFSGASLSQSFTIYPAVITVTATNLTSTYGQTPPALTYSLSPTVNNDPSTVITGTPALSTTATSSSASGPYTIAVSTGSLAAQNYSFLFVNGTMTIQPAGQTISFTTPAPSTEVYNGTFPVVAKSNSGLPVSLQVDAGSALVCSLSSGVVTMNSGTGTCTIDAAQPGNGNYNPATQATTSAAATKAAPTVSWSMAPPLSAAYNSHFTVVASTNSTGAISYSATGGCSNLLGVVTMTSGTTACLVSASAAADANYTAGSVGPTSVTAAMLSQAITFTINPPATAPYNSSFSVAATGGASGNPVTFSSSGACGNSGATYTMIASTGTCSVIANQLGNANYAGAPTVMKSVNAAGPMVTVSPSSINFGAVNLGSVTIQTVTVSNTGTAAATISTPLLSLLQAGNSDEYVIVNLCPSSLAAGKSCTVAVSFVAGAYYNTTQTATLKIMDNAPGSPQQVALSATVLEPQTITFTTNPPASAPYKSSFTVAAKASSALAVTYTSSGACSNSGAVYTMISGTGTCSVITSQVGNSTYAAAPQVTKAVSATAATQTITFTTNAPPSAAYKSGFTMVASASSGLAITFTSSGSCSNSGPTYTMTSGTGTCTVKANQAGNANYAAAAQVTQTVTASLATQAITFTTNAPSSAAYESSFTVAATGGASGNAVTYTSSGSCSNSGAKYTMTKGTGSCSVIAHQSGTTNNYSAAPQVTQTVTATYAVASLGPASLSFGTVSSGKSSAAQTATLTNTGTTPLIISSIDFTGTNPGNFSQTNTCPGSSSSLAAGGSCTISVKFNSGGKAVTANLAVTANTLSGTQTVSLSGS